MRSTKVIATCMFNELLAAGLFPALDGTSMCTDPSISGRKYRKLVYNAVFIHNKLKRFSGGYDCFPIKAHATVATQHMP